MIERVRIRGYRSLHDVDVKLEPLTVLIGRSGTGKSNFVRALRLLRDYLTRPVPVAGNQPFGEPGAAFQVELALKLKGVGRLTYSLGLSADGHVRSEKLCSEERVVFETAHASTQAGVLRLKWVVEPSITPLPPVERAMLGRLTGVREATVAYIALTRGLGCYDFTGGV